MIRTVTDQDRSRRTERLTDTRFARTRDSSAVKYLQESSEIARKVGDTKLEQWTFHCLGIAYGFSGQDFRAIACYEKSLELARQMGDANA